MNDIPHIEGIIIGEYADDIAIFITSDTLEEAYAKAQTATTTLENWANTWCLKFNTAKTRSMCFTKKRILDKLLEPTYQLKLN